MENFLLQSFEFVSSVWLSPWPSPWPSLWPLLWPSVWLFIWLRSDKESRVSAESVKWIECSVKLIEKKII